MCDDRRETLILVGSGRGVVLETSWTLLPLSENSVAPNKLLFSSEMPEE